MSLPHFKETLGAAYLDAQPFGRSGQSVVWVESASLLGTAKKLHQGEHLNWLECMSGFELEGVLVLTYFLRSYAAPNRLSLRISIEMKSKKGVPSVSQVWFNAIEFEERITQSHGVHFARTT